MRDRRTTVRLLSTFVSLGLPLVAIVPAFAAAAGGAAPVESFIKSIIQVLAGLAGLVAAGFFVIGGFSYITSSGDPQRLDKAKSTLVYSALGLSVTFGAFVLSNIVTDLAGKAFGS